MFFVLLLFVLVLVTYLYGVRPYKYWKKRNVKCLKPMPFFGNMLDSIMLRENFTITTQNAYNVAPNARYVGFYEFRIPVLILRDPKLIKQVTVKDFDVFIDHRQFVREDVDPLWGKNLLSMKGDDWRAMRPTLSPSFTSSKMRSMFHLMNDCAEQFVRYFQGKGDAVQVVEMKDVFTRYTNDVIATCAFGIECDSLTHKSNDFYLKGKEAARFTGLKLIRFFATSMSSTLTKILDIKIFSKSTGKFFRKTIMDTIALREKNGIVRPDMIHLLMEARKGKVKHDEAKIDTGFATVQESEYGKSEVARKSELTEDEIVAQALIFFVAGFDTASTLMCFLAYELAVNPDVQAKLFDEVQTTLGECRGKITYEALMGMKYLDMVVTEALRKWPPIPSTDRKSVKPYTIPASTPGEEPLHLPTGSVVFLPIFGIQRDPQFYPNPDQFDPERFSEESKHSINPMTYLPFGAGPRNCIGSRFALLENKAIIFHILCCFELVPVEKTHIPMVLCPKEFSVAAKGGMWLGFKPRKAKSH